MTHMHKQEFTTCLGHDRRLPVEITDEIPSPDWK